MHWHFPRWSDSALRKDEILKRGWQWVWVLLFVSCAGELKDPGRFKFLYDDDGGTQPTKDAGADEQDAAPMVAAAPSCVTTVFSKTCGDVGCHNKGSTQVDLVSPGVAERLVDKSHATSLLCKNKTLISSKGSDSLLIDKLSDDPPCGSPMPVGKTLSDTDRTCLTDWVSSLADMN